MTSFGLPWLGLPVGTETGCILGRNVINQLKLILNGPASMLEIPAEDS
jgi:hypothetical protein